LLNLDFSKFVHQILEREKNVIFVVVVNNQYKLLASEIRKDARTYLEAQAIRNFAQITPPIVLDSLERLEPLLGPISAVVVRYQKRVLLFSRLEDMAVILGLDPAVPTPLPDRMAEAIDQIAKQSLK